MRRIKPTPAPPDDYREPWLFTGRRQVVDRSDESGVFGHHSYYGDPKKILEKLEEWVDDGEI